jgi:hypothetical protein
MRNDRNTDRTRGSKGYILLTVIAVCVLVVTALGTLAKLSLRRALEASDAERSLQQRWGAITIERTMLRKAPLMFQQQEELIAQAAPGSPTPTTLRAVLRLGDVTFDVLVGDEDAKLNLNALYHYGGLVKTDQAIAKTGGPTVGFAKRLLPAVEPLRIERASPRLSRSKLDDEAEEPPENELEQPDAFRSWGEVFDLAALDAGLARDASLPNLTTGMTLWGNGQLNFRRASDEAILAISGLVVQDGAARRIIQRYRESPTATLAVLLQSEVTSEPDRKRLGELMSESSTNFSIWIDASARGGGSLRSFTVMRRDGEGVIRQTKFLH